MKRLFILAHEAARNSCVSAIQAAPQGWKVMLSEPTRSGEQNDKLHAIISEIAVSERLHGKKLSPESWKRLLIDAFKHETKNDPDLALEWAKFGETTLLPALNHDGFVMVGEQSRKFSKKLASAFIEWLLAFQSTGGAA